MAIVATRKNHSLTRKRRANKRAWNFLRHLAELIEVSYRTWWPGRGLAFASDNWQTERSWDRARLGQSNNCDTNVLQQAEYKIAWPLVEWHVPGALDSFGLSLKPQYQ